MATNVVSLEEALSRLEHSLPNTANCKKQIVGLLNWLIAWNSERSLNNKVFAFVREGINIAFSLDRDNNQLKQRKPNFIVIKNRDSDREFKDIYLDLTESGYPPLEEFLTRRPSNSPRWVSLCGQISKMSFSDFQRLFLVAYERKGGVL